MAYGYDNGRRARIGVVGVGCCREEAPLADHCVRWGGFGSGPEALHYLRTKYSTLHNTPKHTSLHTSLTTIILRSSRLHMRQISWTNLPRTLNSDGMRYEYLCESARVGRSLGPASSLNPAFNSAFQRSWSPPALPAHGNFKGTCRVRPLGIAGCAAESQQLALGATWRGPRRDTARLAQHRFLMPKRNRGMPHRAPQFLSFVSDLHVSPNFYDLQDVGNYGALLPLIGDLVWVRSLSFRFVSTRQDGCPTKIPLAILHTKRPASARFSIAKVCMG
jgi:hypothetical protein